LGYSLGMWQSGFTGQHVQIKRSGVTPDLNLRSFLIKELNPRRRVYVEIPKPARVELKCFQSHFIAHLMRSNARDHANPDSGPIWVPDPCSFRVLDCSTNVDNVFQARIRFSRQIKWTICFGFSVDFTLSVSLVLRSYRR
jgi:hypothetical protein